MEFLGNRDRILYLREMLFRETDEDHPLTMQEIISKLEYIMNETVTVKTVRADIEALNDLGFEILEQSEGSGHPKSYTHVAKDFEYHEVQMLVDAVASGRFIDKARGEILTKKLKRLLSEHQARKIRTELIINPLAKSSVPNFHLSVSRIDQAIAEQRCIHFQYGTLDWAKKFDLKHGGERYTVEPVGVVWQESYYYLVAFLNDEKYPRNFRIDRMRDVAIADKKFIKKEFDLKKYISGSLNMFGAGDFIPLTLKCKHEIVKGMIDEFGTDFTSQLVDEEYCIIKVTAKDNIGLVFWLLRWGSSVEVLQPVQIREAVKAELAKTLANYQSHLLTKTDNNQTC